MKQAPKTISPPPDLLWSLLGVMSLPPTFLASWISWTLTNTNMRLGFSIEVDNLKISKPTSRALDTLDDNNAD